ncbi:MAG: diguanylate cyclase [Butyrivibrio sp.]|uniref:sensor domain-containing diguanylate cyclase n=1 Tax=Butyrivibrio sp. TaxID=28121 RepID=UPI001B05DDC6|nr:diguanylate cyclase [Butyrivibrio sp.]MBO6239962.1 diguanylate cyclase [Butyrivibrio sp.]
MRQKTYRFYDCNELSSIISEITSSKEYISASGILMQLYNPRLDIDEDLLVGELNEKCSKALLTGMTVASIAEEEFDIKDDPVQLSVSYFFKTKLYRYEYDLNTTTMFVAGRIMNEKIDELGDVKCMQTFYVTPSSSILVYSKEFSHQDLPVFGAKAGRNIRALNTAHVYGSKCYNNAIVSVVFQSKDLSLFMDNNLDWEEIGNEMVVSKVDGDRIVAEIDGKPAIEVYRKYLKVSPNKFFVQNVCEFPLVFKRNESIIARVPQGFTEDGGIVFNSDVFQGEHFRLSYSFPEKLLKKTAVEISAFSWLRPEGVYFYECGNRQRFLGAIYKKEYEIFREFFPEYSSTAGYSELFAVPKSPISDLNSALVTVGLTENKCSRDLFVPGDCGLSIEEDDDNNREIPFFERLLTFFESTSKDLDELNKKLGKVAFTDQLTKIYNRWELERNINEAITLAQSGKKYSLLFFDIDHFKHVNDTYGHDVGDTVLKSIVNIVRGFIEENHVFGRWGGEEFLYLFPNEDIDKAVELAEKIRQTIDDTCFVTVRHLTVSIGVTMIRADDTIESFVKRADEALYKAKETGRNRVVIADFT